MPRHDPTFSPGFNPLNPPFGGLASPLRSVNSSILVRYILETELVPFYGDSRVAAGGLDLDGYLQNILIVFKTV